MISLDVAGKQNLNKSLEFFIKGDILDGDNMYMCGKCG